MAALLSKQSNSQLDSAGNSVENSGWAASLFLRFSCSKFLVNSPNDQQQVWVYKMSFEVLLRQSLHKDEVWSVSKVIAAYGFLGLSTTALKKVYTALSLDMH